MHRHFIQSSHFQLCLRTLEQKLSAYNYRTVVAFHDMAIRGDDDVLQQHNRSEAMRQSPSQMLILLKHAQVHHCCAHQLRQVPS